MSLCCRTFDTLLSCGCSFTANVLQCHCQAADSEIEAAFRIDGNHNCDALHPTLYIKGIQSIENERNKAMKEVYKPTPSYTTLHERPSAG